MGKKVKKVAAAEVERPQVVEAADEDLDFKRADIDCDCAYFEIAARLDWFALFKASTDLRLAEAKEAQGRVDYPQPLGGLYSLVAIHRLRQKYGEKAGEAFGDDWTDLLDDLGDSEWDRLLDAAIAFGDEALIEQVRDMQALKAANGMGVHEFDCGPNEDTKAA